MHDIRAIRADPAAFDAALARRRLPAVASDVLAQDSERRAAQTALQEKQARRNQLAKEIGQGRRAGADTMAQEAEATALRGEMEALEGRAGELAKAVQTALEVLPNTLDPDVPDGPDEPPTWCWRSMARRVTSALRRSSISSLARRSG
jgi:seryl-tRNA synthetase